MLSILKRLLDFSGNEKQKIINSFIFGGINSLFEILPVTAIITVITDVIHDNVSFKTMYMSFGIMLISILGQIVFGNLGRTGGITTSYRMCTNRRIEIGEKMKYSPMGYFSENRLGELTSTVTTTLSDLENSAKDIFQQIINGFIGGILINFWLLSYEWRLGIISIIGLILALIVFSMSQKPSRDLAPKRQKAQIALVVSILEYVQGMSVVKTFSLGNKTKEAVVKASEESCDVNIKTEHAFSNLGSIYQSVFKFLSFAILLGSSYLLIGGEIDAEKAVMLMVASFMLYKSVEIAGSIAALTRVLEYSLDNAIDALNAPVLEEKQSDSTPANHNIDFKNVNFGYDKSLVLKNISLSIAENTTTALVGASGSGKTTLCNLISRFWDINDGEILLGGVNIKDYSYKNLMSNISIVFQNVYLFEDSIKNNIKFGNPSATDEEIIETAKKAKCHEFISALPNGYDTVIGEGGSTLSGGEKQRIAIARAMLKNAPIIILDEATSSLDPENEHDVTQAIDELSKNKTVIIIAHRLSTVRNADKIVVLNEGKINQIGTHNELIEKDGIYKNFISLRSKAVSWKI